MQVRFINSIAASVFIAVFFAFAQQGLSQTDILKVMYYNILNFPDAGDPDRELDFRKINGYIQADIILVNELTSNEGALTLLNDALNVFGVNSYQKAVFSNCPDTDNMLFYNSDKLALYSQNYIYNGPRYIDEYVLYYKSANLASGEDTIFLRFYSAHLKANEDEQAARLTEVNNFKAQVNSLVNAENIFFGGDLNLYSNTEPAYQALVNDGIYPLNDPLPAGNWHENYTLRQYHTQSTRLADFGTGSTGGMDDRFDFILYSDDVQSGTNGATYIANSCIAFGNDGNHYNIALIDPPVNTNLPDSIIQALYYMSDHLPVICDIMVNATTGVYNGPPDVVITEIMYNPPEAGTDSLEFVELYNNGSEAVNLGGCQFTSGIDFVFPSSVLQPGQFITIAYNAVAMQNTFGVQSLQWTNGGLSNGGELIVLKDTYGSTIDSVYFRDILPWPTAADGSGPSIVLCDPDSDNSLGTNWQVSQNFVMDNGNGDPIYATPSFTECVYSPIASFTASQVNIYTGEGVAFTDASANNPTSWNWVFEGGNPATSTAQNPTVVYGAPGVFNVQLTVSNANGSDVLLKANYISVTDNNLNLVITEIMQNPAIVLDDYGEWFEVFNPTNTNIDLNGWTIKDNDTDNHTIGSSVIVPAKGFAVLGANSNSTINGNYNSNYQYVYNNFQLGNGADEIVLLNPQNEEIDRVEYDGGPNWPDPTGASMVFTGSATDDNMNSNFWETSAIRELTYQGTIGDKGSPGINGSLQNLVQPATGFELQLKVYLEGPFNGFDMNASLPNMPLSQPYNVLPWNYSGSENVTVIPSSVVDWVLVELRDANMAVNATAGSVVAKQAALLLSNGSVVSMDGSSNLQFENLTIQESLFVVVSHRNHLVVMSASPLIQIGEVYSYDFTTGAGQAYNSGQKFVGSNKYAMFCANGEPDGMIDINDKLLWMEQPGRQGYHSTDFDMDGQVNNQDKNDKWLPNDGEESQVPD
jgi:PKD repeat protein